MSKISRIIAQVKEFSRTPAGQVATSGIAYMGSMALYGAVMARLCPAKTTFGRALGAGIYAVGMQTLVGAAMTGDQQQRLAWEKECQADSRREANAEITYLRNRVAELQERLSDAEKELKAKASKNGHRASFYKARTNELLEQLRNMVKKNAQNARLREEKRSDVSVAD